MTLDWQDGLPYSTRFGDVYFSTDSGLEETRHVFLEGNRLPQRFSAMRSGENFSIGETGFGTGLNFLCAWQLFEQTAPSGASLDFFSIEKYPLSDEELCAALALWPELQPFAHELLACWRRRVPGWNRWTFASGRVRLTLAIGDVAEVLPQLQDGKVDAWFLDGFSPVKNPEMWAEAVMVQLGRASRHAATLATYTSAGWVRRGLQQAGFEMERVPGYGRKREMSRGNMEKLPSPLQGEGRSSAPASVLVIGAGLAGCATAHALAQRGVAVTLVDRAAELASAASGNPRGILHARFSAGMNVLHRLVLASYGHALALLDEVLPVDGELRAECGLLQLAATEDEAKRIARLSAQEWPQHVLQFVDAQQASELAGIGLEQGGLWFPAGGWVVPPEVCARLAEHELITKKLGFEVTGLEQTSSGWSASGEGRKLEAEQVVVCCAHQARRLEQFAVFPLQPVRGQISELPATEASSSLRTVLCAEGYCTPAMHGLHVTGATSVFDDEAVNLRVSEHEENLAQLAAHMPSLSQALGKLDAADLSGRAAVRCSLPGAMPLAGEVVPGLYCSLAHGTRGLLTAGMLAEVVAADMCDGLAPLPRDILDELSPQRRLARLQRKAAS